MGPWSDWGWNLIQMNSPEHLRLEGVYSHTVLCFTRAVLSNCMQIYSSVVPSKSRLEGTFIVADEWDLHWFLFSACEYVEKLLFCSCSSCRIIHFPLTKLSHSRLPLRLLICVIRKSYLRNNVQFLYEWHIWLAHMKWAFTSKRSIFPKPRCDDLFPLSGSPYISAMNNRPRRRITVWMHCNATKESTVCHYEFLKGFTM